MEVSAAVRSIDRHYLINYYELARVKNISILAASISGSRPALYWK